MTRGLWMRSLGLRSSASGLAAALMAALLPIGAAPASSQTAVQAPTRIKAVAPAPAAAADASCSARPGLGVGRVLEIDTSNGPRFGNQQYQDHDILRDHEVVLTFDDGPLRHNTRHVLEALEAP